MRLHQRGAAARSRGGARHRSVRTDLGCTDGDRDALLRHRRCTVPVADRPAETNRVHAVRRGFPPFLLVLTATTSVQIGSSLAKGLFAVTPPQVAAWLRILFAAVFLGIVFRPTLRGRSREQWLSAAGYGVALTGMSAIFYLSIQRIPVGMAVTFEFLGPLTVAAFSSKRRRDLIWVAFAALGVILLGISPAPRILILPI